MGNWDDAPPTYEEWEFKNRHHDGQIRHVNTADGTITVQLFGSNEQYVVDIPIQEMSIQGINSSWQRAMPQAKSFAKIGFSPQNTAHCARLMTWNPSADSGMYANIAAAAAADLAAGGLTGLGFIWRELQEGEYDCRSAGGAGYYFTEDGHALFEAGPTTIELDKNRSESVGSAGLWVRGGDGTEARWGDVKRLLPGQFEETVVVPDPACAVPFPLGPGPKEWRVQVGKDAAVGTFLLYTEEAGDVRGGTGGAIPQSGTGLPLRYRKTLYNAAGTLPTLTLEVDAVGNVHITQDDTAVPGGLVFAGGKTSPLKLTFGSVDIEAGTTSLTLGAKTTMDLLAVGTLSLAGGGLSASDGVTLGKALSLYLTTQLSVLTALGPSGPAIIPLQAGVQYSQNVEASI